MNDALGNLIALVAEGRLTRAQAKAAASGMWINGSVPVSDLPVFEVEAQKVFDERNGNAYADRVVQRTWPEIEKVLLSEWLDIDTKEKVRLHPEALRKRAAFKMATFGQRYSVGPHSLVYFKGPATSADLEAMRRGSLAAAEAVRDLWRKDWPQLTVADESHSLKLGKAIHFRTLCDAGLCDACTDPRPTPPIDTFTLKSRQRPSSRLPKAKTPRSRPRGKKAPLRAPSTTRARR